MSKKKNAPGNVECQVGWYTSVGKVTNFHLQFLYTQGNTQQLKQSISQNSNCFMCNTSLRNKTKLILTKDFSTMKRKEYNPKLFQKKKKKKKNSLWLTFLVDGFSASGIKTGFGRIPGTPTMTIYASISYRTSIPTYAAICQSLIFYGEKKACIIFNFVQCVRTSLPSLQVMDYGRYERYETICLVLSQHTVTHQSQKHEQSMHVRVCLWRGGMACKITI